MRKILVAYFSASGVTREVAEKIARATGADIFEIEPVQKYTDADLDWRDNQSRSSIEMNDRSFRPPVANKITNAEQYDTIVIGFPVWWYTAPTIINTFIEENDLAGKNAYIFCTSGTSSVEGSYNDLKEKYPSINFVKGRRFMGTESAEEIKGEEIWVSKSLYLSSYSWFSCFWAFL